jgi:hypothetical protein
MNTRFQAARDLTAGKASIVTTICRLTVLALALSACGRTETWEKPGATPHEVDAVRAACTSEATAQFPPITHQVQVSAGYATTQQTCTRSGTVFHCSYAGSTYVQPVFKTTDDNEPARAAEINDCLRREGWQPDP